MSYKVNFQVSQFGILREYNRRSRFSLYFSSHDDNVMIQELQTADNVILIFNPTQTMLPLNKQQTNPDGDKPRHNNHFISKKDLLLNYETKETAPKRRISLGGRQTIKQDLALTPRRKTTKDIMVKLNYKLSSDVISFEMDEQRNKQMSIINSDQHLRKYYMTFKKLFIILFQASHFLLENMFRLTNELYLNKPIRLICLLFQLPKHEWTVSFLNKTIVLARNIIFMDSSPAQFQRRIDMVARKVTMQEEKRQKISRAFLNTKIQKVWQQTVSRVTEDQETLTFIEDQFEEPQQKMCYLEIKDFATKRLNTQSFGYQLRKYGVLQEIDDDISLDFKFQFILSQQFCFNDPAFLKKQLKTTQAPQSESSSCLLM